MGIFRRRRREEDFSAELDAHLALEYDRLVADGMDPVEARAAARRAFGNVTRAQERFHEASRWVLLEQLLQDLRYAWRGLRHSPAFVLTTVLTLAVGIGLVTVAFTVFDAYFLRPYAIREPSGLHQVSWRSTDAGGLTFRWRDYEAMRERRDLFEAVVAESTRFVSSNGRPLSAAFVSDNYFDALGPAIRLGRMLGPIDAAGESVVISDEAWARLFERDPQVIGRSLDVTGRPFVIVGVLRPEFVGLGDWPRDAWMLLPTYAAVAQPALVGGDQPRSSQVYVRLNAGVTAARASAALTPAVAGSIDEEEQVRAEVRPQPSPQPLTLETVALVGPIFAAFLLVLVTACANVSNVMLARAISRQREMAVRLSLGASRGRVVRQLMTEGLVVAVLAGMAGLALAAWALRAGLAVFARTLPASVGDMMRLAPMGIDGRVFLFALAIAAAATLLFALVPALQASRPGLMNALRGHGAASRSSARLRGALVVSQVAVSLVLVVVAITLARNGAAVGAIDLGYETSGVISVNIRGEARELLPALARAAQADPRLGEVAVTGGNPLFIRRRTIAAAAATGAAVPTRFTFVSPEYFSILRLPIARGRGFRADEARSSARVAIVSEATAATLWPGQDPLGRTIRIEPSQGRPVLDLPGYGLVTVIGTTRDVVSGLLVDGADPGHIYLPVDADSPHAEALLVRGRTTAVPEPQVLQQIFSRVVPDPQVFEAIPLSEMRSLQVYPLEAASWVGGLLGAIALVLSIAGLYGVLAYALSQRTTEIGIRMALGASAAAVIRLMVAQSARLAGLGAVIGGVVAFAVLHVLNSAIELEAISLLDVTAFGSAVALVLAATAVAAYQPARRAARVDPARTLRADA